MGRLEQPATLDEVLAALEKTVQRMKESEKDSILGMSTAELDVLCKKSGDTNTRRRVQEALQRVQLHCLPEEPTSPMCIEKAGKMHENLMLALTYHMPVSFRIEGKDLYRGMVSTLMPDLVVITQFDEKKTRKAAFFKDLEQWGGIELNAPFNAEADSHYLQEQWADHRLKTVQKDASRYRFEQHAGGEPTMVFAGNPEHPGNDVKPWCLWVDDEGLVRITIEGDFIFCRHIWQRRQKMIALLQKHFGTEKKETKKREKKKR